MQGKDQLAQNRVTKLHASFQPQHNQGNETTQYDSLTESDKEFLKILANLYESVESNNIESLNSITRDYAKQLFSLYNKKSSEVEQLQRQYKLQRKGVEELNIRIEQYKIANDELKTINQKNQLEYLKQLLDFEEIKKMWENSKKELELAQRKSEEQSQKIRLLNLDIASQKEYIMSLEKDIHALDYQIGEIRKNYVQLQHEKQRLDKKLEMLTEELNISRNVEEQESRKDYYQCYSVHQDNQSVYSKVSINKTKDNINILKQAEKLNSFDKLSRRSSMDVDNQDYHLDINLNCKNSDISNISLPQYSQREMAQSKKTKTGFQRVGSNIDCFKQKKNTSTHNDSKATEVNGAKKNPPKQSEQHKQKRILNENIAKKENLIEQINRKFQQYKKISQRKHYELQDQIQQLKEQIDHEKTISKKFMKENVQLKMENTHLIETAKQLHAEKDIAERYCTQFLQKKCQEFMKAKTKFIEQHAQQRKKALNMLMQYYKKWIILNCKSQFCESKSEKEKRLQLQNIILKVNGSDFQSIKKVQFTNSQILKKSNTTGKQFELFENDVFKDEPTGDNSNIKFSSLTQDQMKNLSTENVVILPKQLRKEKSLSQQDQSAQVLAEMELSLTLDEDSKLENKENDDSNSQHISKKQIDNQKTANQTPNKEVQANFVQTQDSYFYHINILQNNEMNPEIAVQTVKQLTQQNFQIQVNMIDVQVQVNPFKKEIGLQTQLTISQNQYTQSQPLVDLTIQTQKATLVEFYSQTQCPPSFSVQISALINYQTRFTQINIEKKQFNHGADQLQFVSTQNTQTQKPLNKQHTTQTYKIISQHKQNQTNLYEGNNCEQQTDQKMKLKKKTKSLAIQSQFQEYFTSSMQTELNAKYLDFKKNTSQYLDSNQQRAPLIVNQCSQTELHFQLFDFNLHQNLGFGKVPLTEEEFLSIQTKTKGSKVDAESVASSEGFQEEIQQKQLSRKWTFYNPQNIPKNFLQQRLQIKPLKKVEKSRGPRLSSKSHKVEKDQSSSLIIDVNENDCKQLPPERILEKLLPKPIGSIMYIQKFQQINNKFKWNKDKYYMLEVESQKDRTKEKFLIWKKGIFSMFSRKYLKLKMKGLCFSDPEMINIGNSEIVLRGQQVLIRKKEKNGYVTGGLENGTWKVLSCSLYDSRK